LVVGGVGVLMMRRYPKSNSVRPVSRTGARARNTAMILSPVNLLMVGVARSQTDASGNSLTSQNAPLPRRAVAPPSTTTVERDVTQRGCVT
jgi:hypothetical protein